MKNLIRNWLGINEDAQAIASDVNTLANRIKELQAAGVQQAQNTFEVFHTLPYTAGILRLRAEDAAALTQPEGAQANSLPIILTGILAHARQGASSLQVTGTLPEDVAEVLKRRGFQVEEHEGSGGKSTFIIWT